MKRRTLAEAEAIARARIASIRAAESAAASGQMRTLATSARDRLRLAAIVRDPLARRAAAIRAEDVRAARRAPFARDIERHSATLRADLLVGIPEPELEFDWSPA